MKRFASAGCSAIVLAVLLMTSCAAGIPAGEAPTGTMAPTEVAPPTTTMYTGDAPTTGPLPPDPPPVPFTGGELAGTAWVLDSMNGAPPLESSIITLRFAPDGRFDGSAGCNYVSGDVLEAGQTLTMENLGSTYVGCLGRLGEQENEFVELLRTVTRWEVNDDLLQLTDDAATGTLVFSSQSQDVSGATWSIDSYEDGTGLMRGILQDTFAQFFFAKDGILTGDAGCNDMRAEYTAADGAISVGPVGQTEMGCFEPDGLLEQERAIAGALEASVTYRVEGNKLFLYAADGSMQLVLLRTN